MKKLFAVLLVMSLALLVTASASDKPSSINGWVSDSNCGVKHMAAGGGDCIKKCMTKGAKLAFVSDADKSVWRWTTRMRLPATKAITSPSQPMWTRRRSPFTWKASL